MDLSTHIYVIMKTNCHILGCVLANNMIQAQTFWNAMYNEKDIIMAIPLKLIQEEKMTEYAFTTTVHCGHDGCPQTAYHQTGSHYIAYQVRKRIIRWFCDDHESEAPKNPTHNEVFEPRGIK